MSFLLFYFVWFLFTHHNIHFYFELCTYCNILDIYLLWNMNSVKYLLFYMELLNYRYSWSPCTQQDFNTLESERRFSDSCSSHQPWDLDQSHKSHNALDKYATTHHFVTKKCKREDFFYKLVKCGTWDGGIRATGWILPPGSLYVLGTWVEFWEECMLWIRIESSGRKWSELCFIPLLYTDLFWNSCCMLMLV